MSPHNENCARTHLVNNIYKKIFKILFLLPMKITLSFKTPVP